MREQHFVRWIATVLSVSMCVFTLGCEPSAKDKLNEAFSAVNAKKAEVAEKALDEALKKDPKLASQAQDLRVRIHILRKSFDKAEVALDKLWKERGLDATKLSALQKRQKGMLQDDYKDLYRLWAESLSPDASPKKYEEVLRKGLGHHKKSRLLNELLVRFYESRGAKLIEEGKKVEAADAFEQVHGLYTTPKKRKALAARAVNLRTEAFLEDAQKRFDAKVKPELEKWAAACDVKKPPLACTLKPGTQQIRYDAASKSVLFRVAVKVSRKLKPKKASDEAVAKKMAYQVLMSKVRLMVARVGGLSAEVSVVGKTKEVTAPKYKFTRGLFVLDGLVPVRSMITHAHAMHVRHERLLKKNANSKNGGKTTPSAHTVHEK